MSKGGYRGGSTIVRPGSGWFTYPADKPPAKAKKRHAPTTSQRPALVAHAAQARREALAARAEAVKAKQAAATLERIAKDKEERAERLARALRANGRPAPAPPPRTVGKARVNVKTQVKAAKSAGASAPKPRPKAPPSYKKPSRKPAP